MDVVRLPLQQAGNRIPGILLPGSLPNRKTKLDEVYRVTKASSISRYTPGHRCADQGEFHWLVSLENCAFCAR